MRWLATLAAVVALCSAIVCVGLEATTAAVWLAIVSLLLSLLVIYDLVGGEQ